MQLSKKTVALTFAGGAIGSLCRWLLGEAFDAALMLWVANLVGAAFLGFINSHPWFSSVSRKEFWAVGFCGGFTTMSGLAVWQYSSTFNWIALIALIAAGLASYWLARTLTSRMVSK